MKSIKTVHVRLHNVISIVLIVTTVFTCFIPSAYALKKGDQNVFKFSITEKSDEWKSFTTVQQMIDVYQVPENILHNMTTKSLVYTILENNFLKQYYAYDNGIRAFDAHMKSFNIYRELFSRNDCAEAISDVYSECTVDCDENILTPFYLEEMIAYMIYKDYDLDMVTDKIIDKYNALNVIRKANPDFFNECCDGFFMFANHSSFNYGQKGPIPPNVITTPNGTPVLGSYLVTYELPPKIIDNLNDYYDSLYPAATRSYSATAKFNCHSYAWYSQNCSSNNYWIYDPSPYWTDGSYTTTYIMQNAKVRFLATDNNGFSTHSAIVHYYNAGVTYFISKWGAAGLYSHGPSYCPPEYEYFSGVSYYH